MPSPGTHRNLEPGPGWGGLASGPGRARGPCEEGVFFIPKYNYEPGECVVRWLNLGGSVTAPCLSFPKYKMGGTEVLGVAVRVK